MDRMDRNLGADKRFLPNSHRPRQLRLRTNTCSLSCRSFTPTAAMRVFCPWPNLDELEGKQLGELPCSEDLTATGQRSGERHSGPAPWRARL